MEILILFILYYFCLLRPTLFVLHSAYVPHVTKTPSVYDQTPSF